MHRGLAAVALLVVVLAAPRVSSGERTSGAERTRPFPHFSSWCHRSDFTVAGRPVRAAVCRDTRPGNEPGLVVLYGCGGFGGLDYRLAEQFARARFATMYVDTFALTPPPGRRGFCGVPARPAIRATWRTTVVAATKALASQRGVDPRRVGLLGWSLGADLALAVAPIPGARIAAVVAYSPGVFPSVSARRPAYPPAIELLSAVGDVHSLRGARAFHLALLVRGAPNELYVYPGGSHYWQGKQGRHGFAHALAFLRRAL